MMKMKNVLLNLYYKVFSFNKKAQGLPLRTIIIATLAILALVVMVLILSGTSSDVMSKFKEVIDGLMLAKVE